MGSEAGLLGSGSSLLGSASGLMVSRSCLFGFGSGLLGCGSGEMDSGVGLLGKGSGVERNRVSEQLLVVLCGLQELRHLRERQRGLVIQALRGDQEDPDCTTPGQTVEKDRLETTLTALKQQLCRLQQQDIGLKSHLQQLDLQISELQLDVKRVSSEWTATSEQESDSRPSSGFYELSDGGSLSTSCTSVYSENLSASQSSLLLHKPHSRRTAEECSTHLAPPRPSGLHLGSSRIRARQRPEQRPEQAWQRPEQVSEPAWQRPEQGSEPAWQRTKPSRQRPDPARQRPVSTGDLELMPAQGLSCYTPVQVKKPLTNLKTDSMDPKLQSSLMSHSGLEVYKYPSPMHTITVQNPVFPQEGKTASHGHSGTSTDTLQIEHETRTLGFIDDLLLCSTSRNQNEVEIPERHRKTIESPTEFRKASQKEPSESQSSQAQILNIVPHQSEQRPCTSYSRRHQPSAGTAQVFHRHSCPAAVRDFSSENVAFTSLKRPEKRCEGQLESRLQDRKVQRQRPRLNLNSSTEETPTVSPEFVHAKFVPAESQRLKVRPADRRTRALKLRKPRYCSTERTRETGSKKDHRRPVKGKEKLSSCDSEELRPASGSDSSPCSPGLPSYNKVHARHHPVPAASSSKVQSMQSSELDPTDRRTRRSGDQIRASCFPRQSSRESQVWAPTRPAQWTRHPHSSLTSNLCSQNSRYRPAQIQISNRHLPRCESEYSAECASLFQSTVGGSSEGELSDSSQSFPSSLDSDSSLSLDTEDQEDLGDQEDWEDQEEQDERLPYRRGQVLAEAGLTLLQQLPQSESSAYRIRASRALKKKIRRFHPATLKVMTLV